MCYLRVFVLLSKKSHVVKMKIIQCTCNYAKIHSKVKINNFFITGNLLRPVNMKSMDFLS